MIHAELRQLLTCGSAVSTAASSSATSSSDRLSSSACAQSKARQHAGAWHACWDSRERDAAGSRALTSLPSLRTSATLHQGTHLCSNIGSAARPQLHQLGVQPSQLVVLPAPEVALLLAALRWNREVRLISGTALVDLQPHRRFASGGNRASSCHPAEQLPKARRHDRVGFTANVQPCCQHPPLSVDGNNAHC